MFIIKKPTDYYTHSASINFYNTLLYRLYSPRSTVLQQTERSHHAINLFGVKLFTTGSKKLHFNRQNEVNICIVRSDIRINYYTTALPFIPINENEDIFDDTGRRDYLLMIDGLYHFHLTYRRNTLIRWRRPILLRPLKETRNAHKLTLNQNTRTNNVIYEQNIILSVFK